MKKCRFPEVALKHFNNMPADKLEKEISSSLASISAKIPRNHKEELLLTANRKRVEVLKVILHYKNQDILRAKVEEIAVLID
jgi:hypothetical protein